MKKIFIVGIMLCVLISCVGCRKNTTDVSSSVSDFSSSISNDSSSISNDSSSISSASSVVNNTSSNISEVNETISQTTSEKQEVLSEFEKMLNGVDDEMKNTGISDRGNTARIASLMNKAQKGGNYTIAVLGGSISEGASASSYKLSYGYLVKEWFEKAFPKANFTYVNAGFGSTNSIMACYRLETDLLSYNPDLVMMDFTVNISLTHEIPNTYSALLYRILSDEKAPAVIGIHFTRVDNAKYSKQVYEMGAGLDVNIKAISTAFKNYGVPIISYHDYVWKKINNSVIKWPDVGADYIHPNNNGHKIASNLIISYLEELKNNLSSLSTQITAPSKPNNNKYLSVGYVTNKSSNVLSATDVIAGDYTSIKKRGWTLQRGKTGQISVEMPTGTNAYLLMDFGSSSGTVEVSGNEGSYTVYSADAMVPTLINISNVGEKFTITSKLNSGTATLYGIAYDYE